MLNKKIVGFICLFSLLFSCKTSQLIDIGSVANIPDVKLRNLLKENELVYNKLYLKKVQFTYSDNQNKKTFKGSFVIQKDSFIIVSIYALMGIELIRAKLSPNEVIIIDKHNKKVIYTGYKFFSDNYGIDFNYKVIQALLTNTLFIYPADDEFYDGLKKYKNHVSENYYSFQSVKDKRIGRLNKKSKNHLIVHDINIYPDIYRIFRVFIKDFGSNQVLSIDYKGFKLYDKIMFPEVISLNGIQGLKSLRVDLKINYLEINDGGSTHFKIPSSYMVKNL